MKLIDAPWNRGIIQNDSRIWSSAIWAAFWLLVLTAGEPDLLGAVVRWVERL